MDDKRISEGEQLRLAIIEYVNAEIPQLRLKVAIAIGLLMVTLLEYVFHIENHLVIIVSILSFLIGLSLLLSTVLIGGIFDFINVNKLLNKGLCHFSVVVESGEKYFLVDFFILAKDMIYKDRGVERLLEHTLRLLMPQYYSHRLLIDFYAMPSVIITDKNAPLSELERLVEAEINNSSNHLPNDIKDKGKHMSKAYLMLYCLENTLRLFIEQRETITNPFFINNSVKKKIQDRKNSELQNKYLSVRGNSDLYYMDFKELGDVIINNPGLLKIFPNENWVKAKIEELGNIRNLIAHNSYIGELEIKIIAANYESIIRQIE